MPAKLLLLAILIPALVSCRPMAPQTHALKDADGAADAVSMSEPEAAVDRPMEPRADWDDMGDCDVAEIFTTGARLAYGDLEGIFASTDPKNPTPLVRTGPSPLSGRFFLEAEIRSAVFGPFPRWSPTPQGFVRVVVAPLAERPPISISSSPTNRPLTTSS
jgi:hypothetical protein